MPTFATNPALEAAIIAHADEDTPRLAYADWLDEHGDPDRAAFIRVQCRLADMPPNDPDWVDLREQQDELVARLKSRHSDLTPDAPDGFYSGTEFIDDHEEPYRRGFPHFIDCQIDGPDWTLKEIARVTKEFTRLVRTTTIRGFSFNDIPLDGLTDLLAAPVATELTGLALMHEATTNNRRTEAADFFRFVGTSPAIRRVPQLFLYSPYHPIPAAELAKAKTFDSVRRLTIQSVAGTKTELEKLTKAAWFRRLRHFRSHLSAPAVATPVLTGLGKLPELHTLELPDLAASSVAALTAGKFPALAKLLYGGPLSTKFARQLAKARFPALAVFGAKNRDMNNDGLAELLGAKWFGQLRVLNLADNKVGDKGVKALAAHPVAQTLRVLQLGDNAFGKSGLAAITTEGAFPEITTLDLHSYTKRKGTSSELAVLVAAMRLPHLRHLDLSGWPLGDAGAQALAANPSLAGLTRLNLDECGIGDPGAKALFASPHLQNLVELQLGSNAIKTGADALADPKTMPRLGECWLGGNKLTKKVGEKLERDGLYLIT